MADKKPTAEQAQAQTAQAEPENDVVLAGTGDIVKKGSAVKVAYPKIDGSNVVLVVETN